MHPGFCILKLTPHTSHLFLRATRGVSLGRNSKLLGDTFIWYEQKSKEKATKRSRRCVTRSFYNMCQGCHYRVLESGSRASKGLRPPLNSWQQFLHCIVMASKGLVTALPTTTAIDLEDDSHELQQWQLFFIWAGTREIFTPGLWQRKNLSTQGPYHSQDSSPKVLCQGSSIRQWGLQENMV